jgi:hypothetical protein
VNETNVGLALAKLIVAWSKEKPTKKMSYIKNSRPVISPVHGSKETAIMEKT